MLLRAIAEPRTQAKLLNGLDCVVPVVNSTRSKKEARVIKNLAVTFFIVGICVGPAVAEEASSPTYDSVVDALKGTPATQFELGLFQLQLITLSRFSSSVGKDIGETHFEFQSVRAADNDGALTITVTGEGRARYMSQEACEGARSVIQDSWPADTVASFFDFSLKPDELQVLGDGVQYKAKLVSEENSTLVVDC